MRDRLELWEPILGLEADRCCRLNAAADAVVGPSSLTIFERFGPEPVACDVAARLAVASASSSPVYPFIRR